MLLAVTDELGVAAERRCSRLVVDVSALTIDDEVYDRCDTAYVSRTGPARYVRVEVLQVGSSAITPPAARGVVSSEEPRAARR